MNSVNYTVDRSGMQVAITGPAESLQYIEDTLHTWAAQLKAKGARPVPPTVPYIRRGDTLHVMTGAMLAVADDAEFTIGQPMPPLVARVTKACEKLEEDGILWEHQADAVRCALLAQMGRGIIKVPTAGGKTRISAGLIVVGTAIGLQGWTYLVPNGELATQTAKEFDELAGTMSDILEYSGDIVASFSSYSKASPSIMERGMGLIVDECHGAAAATRAEVLAKSKARWRVGLSATPFDRADGKNTVIAGLFGPIVYEIKLSTLEKLGRVARGKVTVLRMCTTY